MLKKDIMTKSSGIEQSSPQRSRINSHACVVIAASEDYLRKPELMMSK